eukprot:m.141563 g.141563  ORF g.141563 m.141563 type:complete len:327 (+) comp30194_c0_seq1:280-1260(+)
MMEAKCVSPLLSDSNTVDNATDYNAHATDNNDTISTTIIMGINRKRLQNRVFRICGLTVLVLGMIGFAPSIIKAMLTGSVWSVSHDAKHTNTEFLAAHAVGAVVWVTACAVQLYTGGMPSPNYIFVHRVCGYVGTTGLCLSMVLAAANELKYATPDSVLGNVYTLVLVLGATINMLVGVVRARQRRFPEHKDSVLLAIMFTMDPAVHRLAMWSIRLINSVATRETIADVDPVKLLILGKMPANFILYVVFGSMFVHSRRVNRITVVCTAFNLIAFLGGTILAVAGSSDGSVSAVVWGLALVGAVTIVVITIALIVVEKRKRSHEKE